MLSMPTLAELRRNRAGVLSIAAQMTLALAILCNALFVMHETAARMSQPTGADEPDIFYMQNSPIGEHGTWAAQEQADIAALRSLDGVVDAYVTNSLPLTNSGGGTPVSTRPDQIRPTTMAAIYFVGARGLHTLGLHLVAGRDFEAEEIGDLDPTQKLRLPPAVIVTRALAAKLYPGANALGRPVFAPGFTTAIPIVGIVDRLQVPWTSAAGWGSDFRDDSILTGARLISEDVLYVVRTRPGRVAAVEKEAVKTLQKINRLRVIGGPLTMTQAREYAYRDDLGLSTFLAVVTSCLLGVTAAGIVGLTSYWVAKRKRQIGIRRALGATRGAIVWYFLGENLLIAAVGIVAGTGLTLGLSLWIASAFAMPHIPVGYVATGIVVLIFLGQLAALWPAWRAACIPPAIAARSA